MKTLEKLRLIGDIHGNYERYHSLIKKVKYSIQLGDFGFEYDTLRNVDPQYHKVLGGNHDNYNAIFDCENALGNFGQYSVENLDLFYIRGAYSVDKQWRIPDVSWWKDEELSYAQCMECIKEYSSLKPEMVISHDCPEILKQHGILTNHLKVLPSRTGELLQQLFDIYQPRYWIFGHHHKSFQTYLNGTHFIGLSEYGLIDINCHKNTLNLHLRSIYNLN